MSAPSKAQLLKASIAKRRSKKRKALVVQETQVSKKTIGFVILGLLGVAFAHQLLGNRGLSIPSPRYRKHNKNLTLTGNANSQKTFSNTSFNQTDSTTVTHASYHATSTSTTPQMTAVLDQMYSVPTLIQAPSVISSSAKLLATMALFKCKDFSLHTSSIIFAALSSQFKLVNAQAENIELSIDPTPEAQQFYTTSSAITSRHLRDLSKKGIKLNPDDQVSSIKSKLTNWIKPTKNAIEYYGSHSPSSFIQDRDKITRVILTLAKNKGVYCKLSSIFEEANTGFKLEICAPGEPFCDKAIYQRETNKLRIPITLISRIESYLSSTIEHEVHHAFVNYQSRKMGRLFFTAKTKEYDPNSTPCNPGLDKGTLDCYEVMWLQQAGLKKVDDMLAILTIRETDLNSDQEKLLAKYKLAIKGYKPVIEDRHFQKSQLIAYQKNGFLDEQFKFKNSGKYIHFDQNGFTRFFYSAELSSEGYVIAYTQSYKTDDYLKAPLHDLKYFLKTGISEKLGLADLIKETDAVIHQFFGRYPKLINFFYEGLREYHAARSDVTYQRCIA